MKKVTTDDDDDDDDDGRRTQRDGISSPGELKMARDQFLE